MDHGAEVSKNHSRGGADIVQPWLTSRLPWSSTDHGALCTKSPLSSNRTASSTVGLYPCRVDRQRRSRESPTRHPLLDVVGAVGFGGRRLPSHRHRMVFSTAPCGYGRCAWRRRAVGTRPSPSESWHCGHPLSTVDRGCARARSPAAPAQLRWASSSRTCGNRGTEETWTALSAAPESSTSAG